VTAPVFLADRDSLVQGARLTLDGPEGRHAATVRRLAPGKAVVLTDGAGRIAHCKVAAAVKNRLEVDVLDVHDEPPPRQRLVVIQALPKAERGERAVETMTEVGVDVIVPWAAARCIAQWRGERADKALARWRATAREAAKQARRSWLPEVTELASTARVAARIRASATAVVLHEGAAAAIGDIRLPATGDILLIVGPEGGLTPEEVTELSGAGAQPVRLGPTVLRTSTAGSVAAALLLSRTSRWA
jgi:16S rRNA (uracil1498-N3)-methyltransferase